MRLAGKVVWVTGAASGIGEAASQRMAAEGASLVVTDVNQAGVEQVAQAIVAQGGKAIAKVQDVTDEASWERIAEEILEQFGALHVLVNNAGIGLPGTVEDTTVEDFRRVNSINSESVFVGMRTAVKAMKSGAGSIINISSIEGLIGDPRLVAYNASKAAVRLMTKSAALYCAELGYAIRVNSVHPGYVMTPMVAQGIESMGEEGEIMYQRVLDSIPMGRLGNPGEIANGILFLASDESSFMTGSELVIDGGYTAH